MGPRPLVVHVDRPELVEDLVTALQRGGCPSRRTGPRSCLVEHDQAVDELEARLEVTFFLRAWRARHGSVRALLAP